jgi:hypothetical protein
MPQTKIQLCSKIISKQHLEIFGKNQRRRGFLSWCKADSTNIIINEALAKILDKKRYAGKYHCKPGEEFEN